jgi:hypothetical protein
MLGRRSSARDGSREKLSRYLGTASMSSGLFVLGVIVIVGIFGIVILGTVATILVRVFLRPRRVTRTDLFDAARAAAPPYLAADGRYYSTDGRWVWDGATWIPR